MNPLHIPRTILACVGVAIDTAVRMHCQNRDYEAAVRAATPKAERELVEAEAEDEVHEPGVHPVAKCAKCAAILGDAVCVSHLTPGMFCSDRCRKVAEIRAATQNPAASATAAPSPAIPPASDTDPVGVVDGPPASAAPAGPPSELVELIARVLYEHHPREDDGHKGYGVYCRRVDHPNHHAFLPTWREWRNHVAPLIAERIEKATPPAGFTFGDLVSASQIIDAYCDRIAATGGQVTEMRALSDRLFEAGSADPNP